MRKIAVSLLLAAAAFAQAPATPGLTLTSTSFKDGDIIPDKYSAKEARPASLQLAWTNVPAGTVSYVLIMHDPDTAPMKHSEDILHWLAFNIPAGVHELAEGQPNTPSLPDGTVQGKAFGNIVGYRGPGAGAAGPYHHYTVELFAIDMKLDLTADATRAEVLKAIDGHVLGKAAVTGRFHR